MILTKEQAEEMLEAAKPLIKWMSDNCHPHCDAKVASVDVQLNEGIANRRTYEFIKD